jgi:Flp pilus assembly protein TadD
MRTLRSSNAALAFVASGVLAITLSGCAGGAKLARVSDTSPKQEKQAKRDSEKAVARAEKAVERNAQSASLRSELGRAYLQAGRFNSAATAYDDAMRLGDSSAHTALGLALAMIGAGNGREAIAILDDWRESIPASDLGLALSLAGDSSRGVAILTDGLRSGDNSPKLRQNLAFAYALDGRWREARTMMEQDVSADQIDARISNWAMQAKPDDYQRRVAGLLGVPVRKDPGLPAYLALGNTAGVEQAAAESAAVQPQIAAAQADSAPALSAIEYAQPAPAIAVAPAEDTSQPAVANYEPTPVSGPVVQNTFANSFPAPAVEQQSTAPVQRAARPARTVRFELPKAKPTIVRNGSHLVQLGSFSSPQGARRGWGILAAKNPRLREFRMVITPAVVRGKNFWRVAAAGFDANAAAGMCSSVKSRGGACFAYAATRAPAGASLAQNSAAAGPRLARRR